MLLAALVLALASPLQARAQAPLEVDFSNPAWTPEAAEDYVKSWVDRQPRIQKKMRRALGRSKAMAAGLRAGLRDAVAAKPDAAAMKRRLATARPGERVAILEQLPGMKPDPFERCRTLEACRKLPTSFRVEDAGRVRDAVGALVRPWLLLQKARGRGFAVAGSHASSGGIMRLILEGLPTAMLKIAVSPDTMGGIRVALFGLPEPAALFSEQRGDILASAAP